MGAPAENFAEVQSAGEPRRIESGEVAIAPPSMEVWVHAPEKN